MDTAQQVVLFLHLVGFAALFGGAFVQVRDVEKVINVPMLYGALAQVVTGVVLVGILEGQDTPLNTTKMGVKLAVALVVALLCWVNRSKRSVPHGLFHCLWLLTLGNAAIAVFW